nr:DUF6683 family protein [uncultured Roseococcus sp.]
MRWIACQIVLTVALLATPARSQDDFGLRWFNNSASMIQGYMGQAAMASVANAQARRVAREGRRGEQAPALRERAGRENILLVGNDRAVSRQARARFVDDLVRSQPQARPQLEAALASDWQAGYAQEIARPNGLDPRNLADSHAAYLIASWAVVNDVATISPRGIAAVRDAIRADLAARPEIAQLTPAQRQGLAELLNYNTVLVMAQRVRIQGGDRALQAEAARHYAAQFSRQGVDLAALRLTDDGFITR